MYDGITSLTTKLGTLAPYTGGSSFQAGSITSLTNITSPACQINGNATITGDILLGLPQAYLSTTLSGKANLGLHLLAMFQSVVLMEHGHRHHFGLQHMVQAIKT